MVRQLDQARRQPAELLEPGRLLAAGDALLHQIAGLQHLEGDEAVQGREGRLAQVGRHRLRCPLAAGPVVLHGGDQLSPEHPLRRIQVTARLGGQGPVEPDVEDTLQLVGEVLLQQTPGRLGGALDAVAGVFIHQWVYRCVAAFAPERASSPFLHDPIDESLFSSGNHANELPGTVAKASGAHLNTALPRSRPPSARRPCRQPGRRAGG